jgi:hypothetical protein
MADGSVADSGKADSGGTGGGTAGSGGTGIPDASIDHDDASVDASDASADVSVDTSTGGTGGSAGQDATVDTGPAVEICNGVDDNGNGKIDEGCDDDGDGYCDGIVEGSPPVCPHFGTDCDDTNPNIYPGSKTHIEGVDYDCDGKKEYLATIVISVDDELTELCANGDFIQSFGPYFNQWPYADTYQVVLESGDNVIGVSGKDTGTVISAFIATIAVNGQTYRTDNVPPPTSGQKYTPSDPEWNQTKWRYFPKEAATIEVNWCHRGFDDSKWGPAIIARSTNCDQTPNLGQLGSCPWTGANCGDPQGRCPQDFASYYDDSIAGNEPMWIWDYYPVNLNSAWFRYHLTLP